MFIKTNILFIFFAVSLVVNSTMLRFFTVKNYYEFRSILADIIVVLIVGALGYLIKPKKRFIYYLFFSIVFSLVCVINCIYYTNYISFVSVSLLATSRQLTSVADAVVENVFEYKDLIFLWQPVFLFFAHQHLKKKNHYSTVENIEKGKIMTLDILVVAVILLGFFISSLTSVDMSRLGKQWNREYIVMRFGVYTYQINDAFVSLKAKITPLFGYDTAAKNFREYYEANTREQLKNNYTGIFEGKNIIVIHAESIQNYLINKEFNGVPVTPTLNRLSKEGIYFSNFYAQESVGTSSDTEFTFNSSLMPSSSGTVFVSYWNRTYVTIPKLLKEKGYYTFSMHGNNGSMWNRNVVHPRTIGYDHFYAYKDAFEIDEVLGLGLSDKSFFKQAVPIIKENKRLHSKFYATLIMLTNHTPFSAADQVDYKVTWNVDVTDENGETKTVEAPYLEGTILGDYIKTVHYADEALGELIDNLDKEGVLDNTVIVIYGDHDSKLKKSEYVRYYNYDPYTDTIKDQNDESYVKVDFYNYELNRKVPFIIWTKDKKYETEVTKVMGMYDVVPTLGNMFGFYNKYALGHDIFSIDENIVVFPDGNWLTDKMYYNCQKEEGFLLDTNSPVSKDYLDKYNEYSERILKVSDDIIVYDLIKAIEEQQKLLEQN